MTTLSTYDKGDLVRVTGTFTDSAGSATDPSVVICQYVDPSGNTVSKTYITDAEVVKDSTGVYHLDIDADEVGSWHYRWYATGTGQSAGENSFNVRNSYF